MPVLEGVAAALKRFDAEYSCLLTAVCLIPLLQLTVLFSLLMLDLI